ncbi:MAG: hypothetical protein ACERKS_07600 [Candidatus Bathyarchaeota archaeon]
MANIEQPSIDRIISKFLWTRSSSPPTMEPKEKQGLEIKVAIQILKPANTVF